jgi:hypothetical protein
VDEPEPAGTDLANDLQRIALWPLLAIAIGALALLLAFASRNGYHRDELYFLEASRHLAWGYVDQPVGSVALVALARKLFGDSLLGLRLFPALAFASTVFLTGLIARELGGRRFAQCLAALLVGLSPFLAEGHLAGPTVYDLLAWTAASLLIIRILRTGRGRLWPLVGLVVGLGLLDKETILFLLIGLTVGLLVTGQARVFRSPWLWLAALIAVAVWSPVIVWQGQHGWPTFAMSASLRREHSGLADSLQFPFVMLLLPGVWALPVWLAGLWALWRETRYHSYRAFAVAWIVLFVLLLIFIGDRPYYLGPLYVVLLAAGAVVTEEVVAGRRRFFSERPPRRRLIWRSPRAAVIFVVVLAVLTLPIALPVLSARELAAVPLQDVNYNLGEEVGWPELTHTVAAVYDSLPADERRGAVIVTGNYGEAGAIDRYGPALGLPGAFSGHNSFWWWGPPRPALGTTVLVGFGSQARPWLLRYFASVRRVATIHNTYGVSNDEEGMPVWLCRGQKLPWPRIWPQFRDYG